MKTLYCDASFDHNSTNQTQEPVVRGKIAIYGEELKQVDKVAIGKVEGLQQYINVFELTAIARAVEIAVEHKWGEALMIYTDSQTAMYWARAGQIKKKGIETLAHTNALEYLARGKNAYGQTIVFNYIPRDGNPAGRLLEI